MARIKLTTLTMRSVLALVAMGLTLSACSEEKNENVPTGTKQVASAKQPAAKPKIEFLFAGAGLKGIPLLPKSERLSPDEMSALFDIAFPENHLGKVQVKGTQDAMLTATPFVAFRDDGKTVLIVANQSEAECHGCMGALSVFYFDQAGTSLLKSFPLALEGGGWGQPDQARLTRFPNGRIALVLMPGGMWQGFTIDDLDLIIFEDANIKELASFPVKHTDDNGMRLGFPYSVQLIGAELSADGSTAKIRYTGELWQNETAPSAVQEEHIVTLDGVEEPWLKDWKYNSASE